MNDEKMMKHLLEIIPEYKLVGIIHNFKDLSTIESVENYMENLIKRDKTTLDKHFSNLVIFFFYINKIN